MKNNINKLTDDQRLEFEYIKQLLESSDFESVDLGVGLLENYPSNMRTISYSDFLGQKLGSTLYQYHLVKSDTYYGKFNSVLFWRYRLLYFVERILENGRYYL